MSMDLLARALGNVLGGLDGLNYFSVPKNMSADFVAQVVKAANMRFDYEHAFHVSRFNYEGTITPEYATSLRSRETGESANALIVSLDGEFKDLKSLEAFLHVNPSQLPLETANTQQGSISLNQLCIALSTEIAELVGILDTLFKDDFKIHLQSGLFRVLRYIALVYKELGNFEISWKDAWWMHSHFMANNLCEQFDKVDQEYRYNEFEIMKLVCCAAGIPSPSDLFETLYNIPQHSHLKFSKQIEEYWQTGDDAVTALFEMKKVAIKKNDLISNQAYPLEDLNWTEEYDSTVASKGHPFLAMSSHGRDFGSHNRIWELVTEDHFFDFSPQQLDVAIFQKFEGVPQELYQISFLDNPTYIVYCDSEKIEDNPSRLVLGTYQLLIGEKWGDLDENDLSIKCSPGTLRVERKSYRSSDCGNTLIELELAMTLPSSGKGKWKEKPFKLTIEPSPNQGIIKFTKPAQLDLLIPFPGYNTTFYFSSSKNKNNERRKLDVLGDREYFVDKDNNILSLDDSNLQEVTVKQDSIQADLILVSSKELYVNGKERASVTSDKWPNVKTTNNIRIQDGLVISSNYSKLEVNVIDSGFRPLSPIIAAAMGVLPADDESGATHNKLLSDIRGFYEAWIKDFYLEPASLDRKSLGQLYVFENHATKVTHIRNFLDKGTYTAIEKELFLDLNTLDDKQAELDAFWRAFDELSLGDLCVNRDGHTSHWPSRLDLREIPQEKVENYLKAYGSLLSLAETSPELTYLAYPFSIIIRSEAMGNNQGAMLSPLHPLRFAWAWSVQYSSNELNNKAFGVDAAALLHFVDGSNIPCCGPIPFDFSDSMVSIPMEPGDEDVFVAWTFLYNSKSVDTNLKLPALMSGYRTPSAARSGLDRGGVSSAINDFMRVYPYSSDLRIGLYSQIELQRSKELDRAVVSELDVLMKERVEQLPGGIRVLDSQNRLGPPPTKREILYKLTKANDLLGLNNDNNDWKIPFIWKEASDEYVDIRFMEESLVNVSHSFGTSKFPETGAITSMPLKRTFAWSEPANSNAKISGFNPTVDTKQPSLLGNFATLLNQLESITGVVDVACSVPAGQALSTDNAKWTVAGNTYLDPRLLSSALRDIPGDRVLWEWRPPFLPRRSQSISLSTSRPYTVVAKLTSHFKTQLQKELKNSLGFESEESVNQVFSMLGKRGVGIASLLSMGHQHSRGAVGFYLGFLLASVWEQKADDEEVRLVLPLDAVNPVFEAISGDFNDDRKKADLLLLSAKKEQTSEQYKVYLQPVEIKMHSAVNTPHPFPKSDANSVKKALLQVSNSTKTLEGFVKVVSHKPLPSLLSAAITSLVETGLNLSDQPRLDSQRSRDFLSCAATAKCEFFVKKGLLLWFERHAYGNNANPFIYRANSTSVANMFFVDPAEIHKEIDGDISNNMVNTFLSAVEGNVSHTNTIAIDSAKDVPVIHLGEDTTSANQEDKKSPDDLETELPDDTNEHSDNSKTDQRLEILRNNHEMIVSTLEQLGVSTYIPNVDDEPLIEGPASVMYKLKPSPGVSITSISNKLKDIHLALGLSHTQMLREFIDRGCFVLDVPKAEKDRNFVTGEHLWSQWNRPADELAVPIGLDVYNQIVEFTFSASLTPHLLIAGTTGSGKSEALNVILKGLSNFYDENELKFKLIDPKRVELIGFKNDPHLDGEIGANPEDAIQILDSAVYEMEKRYEQFADLGVKNISAYNNNLDDNNKQLPWWLIVLDEYADLTSDKNDKKIIESSLQRLAQKARAAGIHLIIATQKPTVNVINTVVRSNLPAQLALRVNKASESQIIIDTNGAEALSGKGDSLLNKGGEIIRLQCAYTS